MASFSAPSASADDPRRPVRPTGGPAAALFAPAGGPNIGGGHVMRCLTLARALSQRGIRCSIAAGGFSRALLERFGSSDLDVEALSVQAAVRQNQYDYLIFDDYSVGAEEEMGLRPHVRVVVALDDLADRAHSVDLLVDPSYGRRPGDYAALLPPASVCLAGEAFAPLRPAFAERRSAALVRAVPNAPGRVFLSFGLSDVDAIASRAVALLRRQAPSVQVDVALSATAASAADLSARERTDPRLKVHFDAPDVAALIAAADLSIGAGGVSTWERCCLASPTVAVIVADNQRSMIDRLATDGVLLKADLQTDGFEAAFLAALDQAWSQDVRRALKRRSASLCDGRGAERIAEAILAL